MLPSPTVKFAKADPRNWTLGAKIGVTLVAAALIPMAIVSVAATRAGQMAVENAELSNALGSAFVGSSAVGEYLDGVSKRAEQFGTAPDVVSYIDSPATNPEPSFGAAKSSPDVRNIVVVDANGTVISGFPSDAVGRNYAHTAWFGVALSGKPAVGEVSADAKSGRYVFTVASPARRPSEAVQGVVSIGVSGDDVMYALSQSPLIPGGQAVLADHGRIVAARDQRNLGKTLDQIGLGSVARAAAQSPKGTIAKAALAGRGDQVVAWSTTKTGAVAVIIEPRSVFLASIDRLAATTRIALIIVAILAVAAAIALARRLSRPVSALTTAAQAIEADEEPDTGQLEKLGRARDDIGLLTRVFMHMAEQVALREKKLREQVRAMRVEIDHGRRKESVDGIVESDFFKGIQDRAAEMRMRARGDGSDPSPVAVTSESDPVAPAADDAGGQPS